MNNLIQNTVKDIQEKIDSIESAYKAVDSKELNEFKDKAIKILNQAKAKLEGTFEGASDQKEVEEVIEYVKKKADALTSSALIKVNKDVVKDKVQEVVQASKEVAKDVKDEIDDLVAKIELNSSDDDVTKEALANLNKWLEPSNQKGGR